MAEVLVNDAPVALAAAVTSTQTTVTRASASTGWPGDSNGPPSANFRLNVSVPGSTATPEIMLVTGGQGTTTLTVTRAVEPIQGQQVAQAFGTNAVMTPVLTAASPSLRQISSYDETVLTKLSLAPVAYWKLNDPVGSTTAADSSGNGYTLTVHGTVTFGEASVVPSDTETCAVGNGSTGYLESSGTPAKVPTAPPLSVVFCTRVVSYAVGSFLGWGAAAMISTENGPVQLNMDTGSYAASPVSVPSPSLFVLRWDAGNASLNMNGLQVLGLGAVSGDPGAGPVYIFQWSQLGSYFGINPMGRVAFFAGILTAKDEALLMQAFTGV